jgi:AraC-like DNA-binding protein
MAKSRWSIEDIRRVRISLSARQPVRAGFNTHAPREELLRDMHYELELGIVCSGSMRREYEGWSAELQPGQAWLCGMWEPHGYRAVKTPCEVLVMLILPQMLVNLRLDEAPEFNWLAPFAIPPEKRGRNDAASRKELLDIVRRFRIALAQPEPLCALWQRVLLMEILLSLKGNWPAPTDAGVPASFYERVNRAVQLVFETRRLVTAAEAAKACGLSRNYFNKTFQQLMGLSFAKFALRYRLSNAAAQFLRTSDPVKTVAAEWGFTDASHLHHCFQQHYGCSPLEYRRRKLASEPVKRPSNAIGTA